jgi:integrase
MAENDYSNHTIIRYNQAITSIRRIYEDTFHKEIKLPEDLDKDCDKIIEMLKPHYETATLINFISAILWYLSNINDELYSDNYINSIKDKYKSYGKSIKEYLERSKIGKEFELTEREKKTFMKWEDVLKFYQNLKTKLDKTNYNKFLEFVIVSLYVLHPPTRADYANMRVFIDDSQILPNYSENYCVLQTNPRFVFNKYKNVKYKGPTVVKIDTELHNILLDWMEINQSDYLLSSYFKSKKEYNIFTEGTLCRRLSLIFKKYTTVPVTINTLRHSLISYNSKKEMEYFSQKIDIANKMMHAPSIADTYRRMVY